MLAVCWPAVGTIAVEIDRARAAAEGWPYIAELVQQLTGTEGLDE